MFLRYGEYLVLALIVLVFVTQVFVPVWRGIKIFPIFRSRQRKLEAKLTQTREEAHEVELKHTLDKERDRVTQIRGKDQRNDS